MSGYPRGRVLKIDLDEGSPIENVPGALVADGCSIVSREKKDGFWEISVVKPLDSK
jgi:TusA-related sulfurtransferase